MKCMKIASRMLFAVAALAALFIFGSLFYVETKLSESYRISEGDNLEIDSALPISITHEWAERDENGSSYGASVRLFGLFPAGNITVNVVDEYYVKMLGTPFGIKVYTDGVLVVGFGEVETPSGKVNPAKKAGLKEGDFIVSIGGVKVYTNEEVMNIIKNSEGAPLSVKIKRDGTNMTLRFTAARDTEGVFRAGMWVKDSSAGIGTLTFYSPSENVYAGLGHGIADSETGTLFSVNHGEFVSAKIVAVEKGKSSAPGELKGRFTSKSLSDFSLNSDKGVYGTAKSEPEGGTLIKIAMKQEVKSGDAKIYTTVDGEEPRFYNCKIKVKGMGETQNLLVEITDEELLRKTGGIVQGMSGSPIVQGGKLVGAVTHVIIGNSKEGYGIFAETMLESAKALTNPVSTAQKPAS